MTALLPATGRKYKIGAGPRVLLRAGIEFPTFVEGSQLRDVAALRNAILGPYALLWIHLAVIQKLGRDIAFKLMRR